MYFQSIGFGESALLVRPDPHLNVDEVDSGLDRRCFVADPDCEMSPSALSQRLRQLLLVSDFFEVWIAVDQPIQAFAVQIVRPKTQLAIGQLNYGGLANETFLFTFKPGNDLFSVFANLKCVR